MLISMVVAVSANGVIGRDGGLPWRLPEDLRRFRQITMGHPMVMGRRTWESIGRALPGRKSIVLSGREDYSAEGAVVVGSPAAALEAAAGADEVMVIGGGQVYELFLPMTRKIYRTRIEAGIEGDAHFPALNADDWEILSSEHFEAGEGREHAFRFEILERIERQPGT